MNRRNFIEKIAIAGTVGALTSCAIPIKSNSAKQPFYIATWNNEYAVEEAVKAYQTTNNLLDGLEAGIRKVEANPDDQSVGYGGRPDRNGNVTLDACIMNHRGQAGSVSYVQGIKHPISVARKVMEDTPHVMLVGDGAESFAKEQGFEQTNLLTKASEDAYKKWLETSDYKPVINIENHDTVGMLAYSKEALVGGCSTSGLAYKMQGRVGDSPIIGAGLYVDNQIGACVGTGLGEKVLTNLSAFLVVEFMRQGLHPEAACKRALERIIEQHSSPIDFQVALIAVNKNGQHGAYALFNHFNYVYADYQKLERYSAKFFYRY